jgi:hypothetical protein
VNQNTADQTEQVLHHLAHDIQHLPDQTASFTDALATFVSEPEDVTGLQIYNLREMAKSLKMNYERIDALLSQLDTKGPTS